MSPGDDLVSISKVVLVRQAGVLPLDHAAIMSGVSLSEAADFWALFD
jgi:hypothetical protein